MVDYFKIAKEGALRTGLSTARATDVASNVAGLMEEAIEKESKKKPKKVILESKDITEPKDDYSKDI